MFYSKVITTDSYVRYTLGNICNITVNNTSLANSISISSDGSIEDIAEVLPNNVLTLDQNNFPFENVFIKSKVPASPAVVQLWGW